MGRDRYQADKEKGRLGPFVPLMIETLDSPAWRALSHGAQALYIALKRRYNVSQHNNGRLYLSQRRAAGELNSRHNQVARWFRELQHYGFIVMMQAGCLGVEGKGKAPHWRLTEVGYMREPPTKDYQRWDGTPFKPEKTKSRAGNPAHPVPEKQHTTVQENRAASDETVPENQHIHDDRGVPENQHISRLYHSVAATRPPGSPGPKAAGISSPLRTARAG